MGNTRRTEARELGSGHDFDPLELWALNDGFMTEEEILDQRRRSALGLQSAKVEKLIQEELEGLKERGFAKAQKEWPKTKKTPKPEITDLIEYVRTFGRKLQTVDLTPQLKKLGIAFLIKHKDSSDFFRSVHVYYEKHGNLTPKQYVGVLNVLQFKAREAYRKAK